MGWTESMISRPPFVGDESKMVKLPYGRQIDWANVSDDWIPAGGTKKVLPAGVIVSERDGGDGEVIPFVDAIGSETALGLLATPAYEGDMSAALTGYGIYIGGPVMENLLPEATGTPKVIDAGAKTEMQAAGTGFAYFQYTDSSAS